MTVGDVVWLWMPGMKSAVAAIVVATRPPFHVDVFVFPTLDEKTARVSGHLPCTWVGATGEPRLWEDGDRVACVTEREP